MAGEQKPHVAGHDACMYSVSASGPVQSSTKQSVTVSAHALEGGDDPSDPPPPPVVGPGDDGDGGDEAGLMRSKPPPKDSSLIMK